MARRTTTVIDLATAAGKQTPFTVRLRVRLFVMRHARDTRNPVWKVLDDAFSHRYAARRRVRRMADPRNWLMNVNDCSFMARQAAVAM